MRKSVQNACGEKKTCKVEVLRLWVDELGVKKFVCDHRLMIVVSHGITVVYDNSELNRALNNMI